MAPKQRPDNAGSKQDARINRSNKQGRRRVNTAPRQRNGVGVPSPQDSIPTIGRDSSTAHTTEADIRQVLSRYFPGSFEPGSPFLDRPESKLILGRLCESPQNPLNRTQANLLLHLCHEAGFSDGFFRYYFLTEPARHPYPVARVTNGPMPSLDHAAIWTVEQLDWGLRRFFTDALLYWGNIRSAYRELRTLDYGAIES